jgi:flagellum-specific peptidoglycan hydrolase FlgJ
LLGRQVRPSRRLRLRLRPVLIALSLFAVRAAVCAVGTLALPTPPSAVELSTGEAARLVGPAARIRSRLEVAAASLLGDESDPKRALAATATALDQLAEWTLLSAGPEGGPLDASLCRELAAAAVLLRVQALGAIRPFPEGRHGEFLARIAPGAVFGDWSWGGPASVTMAQAILESGWGKSAPGYNLFGIKGEGTAGSAVHRVVEWRDGRRSVRRSGFRLYRSFEESIDDHSRLLATAARYADARAVSEDPARYARALQGRYASDPRYASKLDDLAARYGLTAYNWQGRPPLAEPSGLAWRVAEGGPPSPFGVSTQ